MPVTNRLDGLVEEEARANYAKSVNQVERNAASAHVASRVACGEISKEHCAESANGCSVAESVLPPTTGRDRGVVGSVV